MSTATRTLTKAVEARWPGANYHGGIGTWATVSYCLRPEQEGRAKARSVNLYPTKAKAVEALDFINRLGCGGFCERTHRLEKFNAGETQ